MMATRVVSPVFVGRAEERRRLDEVLDRAAAGELAIGTIDGDPGIGKTRLTASVAERAEKRGFRALVGGCMDVGEGMLPYAPVLEALRPVWPSLDAEQLAEILGPAGAELRPLVPELGHTPADAPTAAPGRVFELIRGVVDRLARRRPLLLVVEDIHWADNATRDLLRYLSRNLHAPVALLVTYRAEEVRRRYPLRQLVADLRRHPACRHLSLTGLAPTELDELLQAILGHPAAPELSAGILARSQGNPFYAEELLAVRDQDGAVPDVLRDVLLLRVDGLPEDSRRLLRVAAVAGTRVSHELLAAVSDEPEERLTEQLRPAVDHSVLKVVADSYAFRHTLVREVLYADLLPGERQTLHTRYARVLAARDEVRPAARRASELGQLAYHWHAGGHAEEALVASVRAALAAEDVSAPGDAERHYDRALLLWDQVPDAAETSPLDRAAVLWRAANAAHVAGDYAHAMALIAELLAAVDADREPERASGLLTFLGYCRIADGDVAGADAAYTAAVAAAPTERPTAELGQALAGRSHTLSVCEHNGEALDSAREALRVAERFSDLPAQARALNVQGIVLGNLGRFPDGLASLERAQAVAEQADDRATLLWTRGNIADILFNAGRAEEAVAAAADVLPMARSMGAAAGYGVFGAARGGEALVWLGRWDAARRSLDELLAIDPPPSIRVRPLLGSALLRYWRGEWDAARAELALVHADQEHSLSPAVAATAFARQALLAAAEHRFADAVAYLRLGVDCCDGTDDVVQSALLAAAGVTAQVERARVARVRHDAADEGAAREAAAELIDRAHAIARAPGVRDMPIVTAELAVAEAEWSGLRRDDRAAVEQWRDAVARWDALDFPYPAASARWRLAGVLLDARIDTDEAVGALTDAWTTASALGAAPLRGNVQALAERARIPLGVRSPAPERGDDRFAGLTRREQQVLALLADGLSNRRIAQELFISEKTASVHVTRILAKLGVQNRAEAGAVARRIPAG